jgi:putative ABC transport system ATP-binding protein
MSDGVEPVVAVRGLFKSHPLGEQRIEVLTGLDLEVGPGELTAVMGPSGVGKSTLLGCLAGLDTPDRGEIRVLGRDLASLDDHGRTLERRRRIGVIYQFFNLVPNLDVEENVALPYLIEDEPPDGAAIARVLERVGMTHRRGHLPSQLSGGELQLVSIARAIVRRPALLLADEPTGNVNVATGRRIMALLREVLKETGCAMVLVTHNPEDAARADRVVFLKDGRIDDGARLRGDAVSVAAIHQRLEALGI